MVQTRFTWPRSRGRSCAAKAEHLDAGDSVGRDLDELETVQSPSGTACGTRGACGGLPDPACVFQGERSPRSVESDRLFRWHRGVLPDAPMMIDRLCPVPNPSAGPGVMEAAGEESHRSYRPRIEVTEERSIRAPHPSAGGCGTQGFTPRRDRARIEHSLGDTAMWDAATGGFDRGRLRLAIVGRGWALAGSLAECYRLT